MSLKKRKTHATSYPLLLVLPYGPVVSLFTLSPPALLAHQPRFPHTCCSSLVTTHLCRLTQAWACGIYTCTKCSACLRTYLTLAQGGLHDASPR